MNRVHSLRVSTTRLTGIILFAALALAGCDSFNSKKEKLPGERISVLSLEKEVEPDASIKDVEVALPHPVENMNWPQAGGGPTHFVGHPALPDKLEVAWTHAIGEGQSRFAEILASPLVVGDRVYAMDAKSLISARVASTGKLLWEFDVTPTDDDSRAWGGGIAYDDGKIIATTGFGQILALDAETAKELWRVPAGVPVRSAPTVAGGRIFVITIENQLQALDEKDGHRLWTYDGVPEPAQIATNASPAVEGDTVVAPFASGEIVAFRVQNGRVVWTDSLAATKRFDALSTLADIRGRPVIDHGKVFAISHSGRMAAIDLRTGDRVWEQDLGGIFEPWVVGDYVYVLTTNAEVICLTRNEGRIRWITNLDRWEDPEDKSDPITWSGPVLAGDRLVVVSSLGEAWSLSPYTGKPLGRIMIDAGSFLPPVVAGNTLYLLNDDSELMALR
jgi:outer membrane protein assembly factor BamB